MLRKKSAKAEVVSLPVEPLASLARRRCLERPGVSESVWCRITAGSPVVSLLDDEMCNVDMLGAAPEGIIF